MKKVTSILLLLLCFPAYSQPDSQTEQKSEPIENSFDPDNSMSRGDDATRPKAYNDYLTDENSLRDSLEIYFRQDVYAIEPRVRDNFQSLEHLSRVMNGIVSDSLSLLGRIEINSWTSPEPGEQYNDLLSRRRSNSLRQYILDRWAIPDSLIVANGRGVAWDKLRALVAESDMAYRNEVLDVIDNVPVETWGRVKPSDRWLTLLDSREKHLMDLYGGRAYKYLYDNLYPHLRYGSQISFFYKEIAPLANDISFRELSLADYNEPLQTFAALDQGPLYQRVPLFAVKTNLLFDAISVLNVEVEVPIKDRFSINAAWTFPWWVTKNNGYALELLLGTLEGRYWFGDRSNHSKLTGWFLGGYAEGGIYDFQWNDNGYQGEIYTSLGLTAGYAHTINKKETLRMEYSAGAGYFTTGYRYYEGRLSNKYLVWQYDGRYAWLGPTKAKVSLVWMIHKNRRIR